MVKYAKNLAEFNTYLDKTKGKLMVVDFTATWCGPCRMIAPMFEKLAAENADVIFIKVDVDDAQDVAAECKIQSMPTFKFFKDGAEVKTFSGADPAKLARYVAELK